MNGAGSADASGMRRAFIVGFAGVAIAIGAAPSGSTPDPSFHRRVLVLGIDSVSTWSIVIERTQPGSHYHFADSILVERADFEGRILQRDVLRVLTHSDTSYTNRWRVTESRVAGPDAIDLMRTHRIPPAYPDELEPCGVTFSEAGARMHCWGDSALVIRADGRLNWEDPASVRLLAVYETPTQLLLHLASGGTAYDIDYIERLVPVDRKAYEWVRYPLDR